MKKTLCLLICFAMLFGMLPNVVSALPELPGKTETVGSAPVRDGSGIDLPDVLVRGGSVISDVSASDIKLVRGFDCYIDGYYNDQYEYIEYNRYDYRYVDTDITLYFANGGTLTLGYLADRFYYDGNYYTIETSDDQKQNPWDVGVHTVDCSVLGYDFSVNVEIVETPVTDVVAEPITIIERCNFSETSYYDEQLGQYCSYERYNYEKVKTDITVYFEDGSSYDVNYLNDGVSYNGGYYEIKTSDDQSKNKWTANKTYTVVCSVLNYEFTVDVKIIPTPVKSVTADPIIIVKDTHCYQDEYYDPDSDSYVSYTHYDVSNINTNITVNLLDGSQITINRIGDPVEYLGYSYYTDIFDTQWNEPWDVGTNKLTLVVLGRSVDVNVTIIDSHVLNVEAERIQIIKGTDQSEQSYYDEALGQYVDYTRYDYEDNSTVVTVTLDNGETVELYSLYGSFYYPGDGYYGINIADDGQKDGEWDIGVHTVNCTVMNHAFTVEVEIIESPVESVTAEPIKLVKGFGGYNSSYYDGTLDSWVEYYRYNYSENSVQMTVNLKNGEKIEISRFNSGFEYNGSYYYICTSDDQDVMPWDTGTHKIQCSVLGYDFEADVDIVDSPVISVSASLIRLLKGNNGYYDSYYDNGLGEWVEYFHYEFSYAETEVTVSFNDGTSAVTYCVNDCIEYCGGQYRISYTDTQQSDPWNTGVHYVTCSVLGYEFTLEVVVTDSFVADVETEKISMIKGTNRFLYEYYDDSTGGYVTYMRYDPCNVATSIVLTMEDGGKEELCSFNDGFYYNGRYHGIEMTDDGGQEHDPWDVGVHTITYSVMNFEFTVTVEILPTPVQSVETQRITIVKGYNCFENGYYDETSGDYILYDHYNYRDMDAPLTVTFKDGSEIVLRGLNDDLEYDGAYYYADCTDDQYGNAWDTGEHEAHCSLLGYDFTVVVEIVGSPVTNIVASPITLIRGCRCYQDYYYDEATGMDKPFTHYDVLNKDIATAIEVYFSDGTKQTLSDLWGCVSYEGAVYGIEWNDDQYLNRWKVGSENRLLGKLLGYEFAVPVEIVNCPVVSCTAERITIIKNNCGNYDIRYDGATAEYVEFFWYYMYDLPINVTFEFDDGTSCTVTDLNGYETYKGIGYELTASSDQYDDPWDVGVNYLECNMFGYAFNIEVEIIESPVVSVTADEITIVKDNFGYYDAYYDDAAGEYIPFYRYRFDQCTVNVTAVMSDGGTVTAEKIYDGAKYKGIYYDIIFTDPQYGQPWGVGSHTVPCTWMGYDFTLTVNVIENPIESITADPVSFYDGAFNGSSTRYINGEWVTWRYYYYIYKCSFTVNFKDGTKETFNGDKVTYKGITYAVDYSDDQSYDNVWTVGDHPVNCTLLGVDVPLTVQIITSPVKSVTAGRYTIIKNTHCHDDVYYDDHGQEIWFTVYDDVYRDAPITVEFNDGTTVETRLNGGVQYNKEWFTVTVYENQVPPDGIWDVGVNEVRCSLCGCEFTLEVEITETPVDHVEADNIVIIEKTYTDVEWYYDNAAGDWVESYYYNYTPLVNLTVYFKDGTSAQIVNGGSVVYNGLDIFFDRCDGQDCANVWGVGRHRAAGRVGGFEFEFDVVIKENPIASFDVKDAVVYNAPVYDYRDGVEYLQKHITFELTTKSGEVLTGNLYDGVIIDGAVVKPDTDEIFNWLQISTEEYECTLGTLEDSFTVTVLRNPFDGASSVNHLRIPDNAEKVKKSAVIDGAEVQYYAYEWEDGVGDIKIYLVNDIAEHILSSSSYVANDEYTEDEYNRVWEQLDRAGERFTDSIIRCCFERFADMLSIDVVGMTCEQLDEDEDMKKIFAGIVWRFLEVTDDGRYVGVSTGREYLPGQFDEAAFWEEIKLAYTDPDTGVTDYADLSMFESGYDTLFRCVMWECGIERSFTVSGRSFEYDGKTYTIELSDEQMYEEWSIGWNPADINIIDETGCVFCRCGIGVDLYRTINVESITIGPKTLYEYESWIHFEGNDGFKEYGLRPDELDITMTADGAPFRVELRDWWYDNGGGSYEIEFDYCGDVYYLTLNGWQSLDTPWHDGVNTVEAEICGKKTTFTVTVIGIESVKADDISIMKDAQTDENGIYQYFPRITVTYTDKTVVTTDEEAFWQRYYADIEDTQDQSRWGIGTHTAYVTLNGEYRIPVNVQIIENTVDSVSVRDITLFEDKDGYRYAVYNSKTGKYVRGEAFYGDVEFTVTFKDGTSLTGVGSIEYEGETYYADTDIAPENMLNPYCLGSGAFAATAEIMGKTADFTITIVESYYDTHAYVAYDPEELQDAVTVLDDDKYEKGTVLTVRGLDPVYDIITYLAISAGLDGSTNFYAVSITADKNGSRVQPSGKVRVVIDFSTFADQIPNGYSMNDVALYSSTKKGTLTELEPVFDEQNMTITFELNSDEYYVIALTEETTESTPGDVNGDGEIDNKDVVTLFRFLSGVKMTVALENCDFNKDGKVNNKDVTLLFRYLS